MSTTTRLSITLTAPQMVFLEKTAEWLGISTSELIRRILDQYRGATPKMLGLSQQSEIRGDE